jgi:hypothetical protein
MHAESPPDSALNHPPLGALNHPPEDTYSRTPIVLSCSCPSVSVDKFHDGVDFGRISDDLAEESKQASGIQDKLSFSRLVRVSKTHNDSTDQIQKSHVKAH